MKIKKNKITIIVPLLASTAPIVLQLSLWCEMRIGSVYGLVLAICLSALGVAASLYYYRYNAIEIDNNTLSVVIFYNKRYSIPVADLIDIRFDNSLGIFGNSIILITENTQIGIPFYLFDLNDLKCLKFRADCADME